MTAVLLVSPRMPGSRIGGRRERDGIDETAKRIVLEAYRDGCHSHQAKPFDEALKGYMKRYPHVKKELAGHAVAHILATAGM